MTDACVASRLRLLDSWSILMKISRHENVVVVEDGAGARYGLGVLVPAMAAGALIVAIWPPMAGQHDFDFGVLTFAIVALVLAVLNPPRTSEFDLEKREIRLSIGWPPMLGRRKTIPIDAVCEVEISQVLRLGDDLGSARPVLLLDSGERIFLSTYKRSPKRCREIVEQVRPLLGTRSVKTST